MFRSARLKLTAWYLLIIMLVSGLFSLAIYRVSTFEIDRVIVRVRFMEKHMPQIIIAPGSNFVEPPPNPKVVLDELQSVEDHLKIILLVINGSIFVLAGGIGYFLAGRTLKPIQQMVDDQNQFISDASHELRTPIATLRAEMEASLLEKHLTDKEAREVISSNLEELGKLQELANSLLKLAHIHNTNLVYNDTISLHEVIQTAYRKISPIAKKKHITFAIERIHGTIKGDKNGLTEVFVNLFDNAIKYSPEKTKVTIAGASKKSSVIITVSDEGIGIAEEDMSHIFDRFYRVDKSRSQADGHGLGLSIAKKIVTAHNGSITVTSKLHRGTTFSLTFPLKS